jgi:hypothetical protein
MQDSLQQFHADFEVTKLYRQDRRFTLFVLPELVEGDALLYGDLLKAALCLFRMVVLAKPRVPAGHLVYQPAQQIIIKNWTNVLKGTRI